MVRLTTGLRGFAPSLRRFTRTPPPSCPDLIHCCPVQDLRAGRMAWIQPGFEGFGGIGTRIDAWRPGPQVVMPDPHIVMPGLVPGISLHRFSRGGRMDTRNKSGHDERACPEPAEGGVRASRARGGSQTPRAPEPPGGPPFSLTQWLNRTAMDLIRASLSLLPPGGRMDGRNKSGHDERRVAGFPVDLSI